jgi:beta-lactamase regulating signal transducer with metallopeptidase domain
MSIALLNHLWQSTLFALVCGLLTLPLRKNRAATRYGLWFAASVKFLIPFSLLTAMGSNLFRPLAHNLSAPVLFIMQPAAQPFSAAMPALQAPAVTGQDWISLLLPALWMLGSAAILVLWLVRWLRLRAVLRGAADLPFVLPLPVKSSPALLEPGLVGVWRPVLLLPRDIESHLSTAEMQAVLAHEVCHWKRRDNLTAAVHMLVEVLFWFHPLVWWLGARLVEEREKACDESVLESGSDPQIYAEGILKVCKLYFHSPLACASGVSGADLKRRVETIMENKFAIRLNAARKFLLAASGAAAIALPLALGLVASPLALAQTPNTVAPSPDLIAKRLAEQMKPRKAVPLDPARFDKYVGYYRLGQAVIIHITRDGDHFYEQVIGQPRVEMFPESPNKFFLTVVAAQFSFNTDASGHVVGLILHQNGLEQDAVRIADATARKYEAALAERIKAKKPSPGTKAAVLREIEAFRNGKVDSDKLSPGLAAQTKKQISVLQQGVQKLGPVKSITFKGVLPSGMDVYAVAFANGNTQWLIAPLTTDGKIEGLFFHLEP